MKKILITGANGLLGQALVRGLANKKEYAVYATARSEKLVIPEMDIPYFELDIANGEACREVIRHITPDVIINAAAYTHVDGCETEKEKCWLANVKGVENLARFARKNMALLVQLSTDYIFDGTEGPYDEYDIPSPLGYYGRAKLAAENAVRMAGIPYAIVRTNVIFGTGINVKNNFFLWLYESLKAGKQIRVVTDQYNNPVLADTLAEGIRLLVDNSKYGVYHLAGKDYLNRYEYACQLADTFGFFRDNIQPILTSDLGQAAPRPMKGGLKIDRAEADFGYSPGSLPEMFTSLKPRVA